MADVNAQTITIYKGEDVPIVFSPVAEGTDATGWTWALTVELTGEDPVAFLTSGDGISVSGDTSEVVRAFIPRSITQDMEYRTYKFDLWRTDSGYHQRKAGGVLVVKRQQYDSEI